MNIQHKRYEDGGRFFVEENSELLGKITYTFRTSDEITIDHTQVDARLKGKGIGRQLVNCLVEWARQEKLKVIPRCSFAKALFTRVHKFADVLA
jgi:uncharacterized protein